MGFCGSDGKESAYNGEDLGSIPGLGRSSGGGHGSPLQYSHLENSMDRGAWWAAAHGVAKSRLSTYVIDIILFLFFSFYKNCESFIMEKQ